MLTCTGIGDLVMLFIAAILSENSRYLRAIGFTFDMILDRHADSRSSAVVYGRSAIMRSRSFGRISDTYGELDFI